MMGVKRRLACCTKDREISIDFDEQQQHQHERIMTYDGLESCILNCDSYRNESGTSREYGFSTDSVEEDDTSCSSSKDAFGSFIPQWTLKKDDQETDEWDIPESPQKFYIREKPAYVLRFSDLDAMKEIFAKLLLGEDLNGGCKGVTTALALSNGITNLAASVFGELWKLEPLPEENKAKWRKEMDWYLSPANHMVELVPAKQSGINGHTFEIMTPKARADVHMNLPALQKLDSMLIEILDSMLKTEFWYSEDSSRCEGKDGSARQSRRWWLPCPRVPAGGLSENGRKKLLCQGNVVHQVFKAAKSINEDVLREMPVPGIVKDALPKSGRASLGEGLYKVLSLGTCSSEEMVASLKLKSDHEALEAINKLEAAAVAWRDRIKERVQHKSHVRTSWRFKKDPISEVDKVELMLFRLEALLQQLKMKYPFLPHSFLDASRVQYGKDIGHSILEAYSRVIANLGYKILSRIGDILQEDQLSNPSSLTGKCCFLGLSLRATPESPSVSSNTGKTMKGDGYTSDSNASRTDSEIFSPIEPKTSSATDTPGGSCIWCSSGSPSVSS